MGEPPVYDVVVLGGAFSGAATALLLRRECPRLRVLIVEKAPRFDEKVGEATTEMSALFLTRRLGLWEHLEREHLPKEALRYWFHNDRVHGHAEASETGAFHRSAVPSFQLRRDVLDEHLLATAVAEGADLLRPARAREVTLGDFAHRVTVERDGEATTVACRWLLDATGRATLLGRKLGLIDRNEAHPTAAIWARWTDVRHLDDLVAREIPALAPHAVASRRLATNHYVGFGYWVWVIPLGNGETSIGVVFDKRLVGLHESRSREADYRAFLAGIPALAELLKGATLRREDLRFYAHLPYVTRQYMGEGWALLGDAAAFLDPYYSPGLDHAAFTAEATAAIVKADATGEDVRPKIREHNATFLRSYQRFFQAVYRDKYVYMGEHDLLSAAFLLDTAQYYVFLVIPAYRQAPRFPWMPVLGPRPALVSYRLMDGYNRRFTRIALLRRELGEAGRRNDGRRVRATFNLRWAPYRMLARGLSLWLAAELDALRLRAGAWLRRRSRPVVGAAILGVLLAGCAASGAGREGAAPDPVPALRQTVEELRREVAELRADLDAQRRAAAMTRDLLGLREELEGVQTAFQALIRDLEQRQLEGSQAVDRRLVALGARLDELAARVRRAEAAVGELSQRAVPTPAPAPPAPAAPAEPPAREPAATPAAPARARTIQRVTPTEAADETRVSVEADGPLSPRAFTLADPPRLVVDLEHAAFGFDRTPLAVDGPIVERIRFIQLRAAPTPVIRLVLSLKRPVPYWLEPQARGLVLHLGQGAPPR